MTPTKPAATTNNSNGVPWWMRAFERYGLPTVAVVALSAVVYLFILVPGREHQGQLIESNILSQKTLTESTQQMSKAIGELTESFKTVEDTNTIVKINTATMKDLLDVREQQTQLLTEIRDRLPKNGG